VVRWGRQRCEWWCVWCAGVCAVQESAVWCVVSSGVCVCVCGKTGRERGGLSLWGGVVYVVCV